MPIAESNMQEILLSTEQVARYLKVDKFTVYRIAFYPQSLEAIKLQKILASATGG